MAKKKRKTLARPKKKLSGMQIFFLGVFSGLGLYWLPLDHEFSPTNFSENTWAKQPVGSVFSHHLPTTAPLIQREGYILAYDGRNRNAHWVYHKLTSSNVETKLNRAECDFREDPLIPEVIRATKKDYVGTGFDRGHLFAAADSPNEQALENSFYLTNIAPQAPAFNRGYWKRVENHVRDLTKEYQVVHIFSGPLYLSEKGRDGKRYIKYQVIGPHEVSVPTHFFTLIFVELPTKKMMEKAYILPNKSIDPKTPLKKFLTSVEDVEKASGVMFTHILE